jgi:hypothetical protein
MFKKFRYKGNLGKDPTLFSAYSRFLRESITIVLMCVCAHSTTEPIDDLHEICCEPYDTGSHPNVLVTNNIADTGTCEMGATAAPFHIGPMNDLWN